MNIKNCSQDDLNEGGVTEQNKINNEIDKISSEEGQKKPQDKKTTQNKITIKEIEEIDEKFEKLKQKLIITTQEQRIKRIRTRVTKDPASFSQKEIDALYKIVLVGDSGVGKTSLLLRFSDNIFSQNPLSTVGVDFKIKTLKVDQKVIKMQIWDTAGQERFRSATQSYFRNAHGCIAIYDISQKNTFESLKSQIEAFIQARGSQNYLSNQYGHVHEIPLKKDEIQAKKKQKEDINPSRQYVHTEGPPVERENKLNGQKDIPNFEQLQQPQLYNVILVGTKNDLFLPQNDQPQRKNLREVEFQDAIDLCKKMGLAGCLETNSRIDSDGKKGDFHSFADLNDAFFMSACNCVDNTTKQLLQEMADIFPGKDGLVNQSIIANETALFSDGNWLNQTFYQKEQKKNGWVPQSEEGIVQRAKLGQDSFYSFRLDRAGPRRREKDKNQRPTDNQTVYDGRIVRKRFDTNYNDSDLTSSDGQGSNSCC